MQGKEKLVDPERIYYHWCPNFKEMAECETMIYQHPEWGWKLCIKDAYTFIDYCPYCGLKLVEKIPAVKPKYKKTNAIRVTKAH